VFEQHGRFTIGSINMNYKLLFDCHTFDAEPQGTSTFLSGLINALPIVISKQFPSVKLDIHCAAANATNVSTYITVPHTFHLINTGFVNRNVMGLPRLAKHIGADVVISQYVRPVWVPKHSVSIIHDLLFVDFPQQFSARYRISRQILFGLSARFSSKVYTVSEYSRDRIGDTFNIDGMCIGILPNATDPVAFKQAPVTVTFPDKTPVQLLYVSRLEQRKRHEWCVRAFEDLRQEGRDVHLTLIGGGGGDYANHLRQELTVLSTKHGGRLTHLEGIPQSRLQRAYAGADVFLFPSLCEGFGIPVIEAAAQGVPCVVTDGSALSELRAFYVGASFKPDDYQHFLQTIRHTIDHLDQYKADALVNIAKVTENFSWEVTARRFVASILDLGQ
jgi:glycosyltransferase involved in cell wall biosynthesis